MRRQWAGLLSLVLVLAAIAFGDGWVATCGFDGCPSAADIRAYRPTEGGRILDRANQTLGRLRLVRRVNVPLSQVPAHVRQAFIAVEDRRFAEHHGVDWRGAFRAVAANVRAGGVREGFSTITMQVVRNTFAVERQGERSLQRKLIELRLSRLIEHALSKDQILELYLNVIYLGNGAYGVEAASRDLFGRSVKDVSVGQGAMLAALPKGPSAYTPRKAPERALRRRNLVLALMAREGYLDPSRARSAAAERLVVNKEGWRPDSATDSYALDVVRDFVDSIREVRRIESSDLIVTTTLDTRAQKAAENAVRRRADAVGNATGKAGAQGAMVALDPRSGDLRALVGGRRYERGNFNRAIDAHRQPGSAFKPFVYAAALMSGMTPATEVDDEPVDVAIGNRTWSPQNYEGEYLGRTTLRTALAHSANAATVRVSRTIGEPRIVEVAHRSGITSKLDPVPSIALGALEVSPLELVTAYAPFANGGFRVAPRLVLRIAMNDGTVLWSADPPQKTQVMDAQTAFLLTSMLRSVVDEGTGHAVRDYGVTGPVAGKTGTTNNGTDVWFVGYTPTLVAGFWFGYDDPRTLGGGASGGRLAAPAWAEFYLQGWRERGLDWAPPEGLVRRTIDASNGYLATEWCPTVRDEWFRAGTEPTGYCPIHTSPAEPEPQMIETPPPSVPKAVEKAGKSVGRSIGKALKKIFKW
jgi:penicillin-binding protein 1A